MRNKSITKLEVGDVIKHKAFMDVAVQVTMVGRYLNTEDMKIHGVWLNQGQNKSFVVTEENDIRVIPCEFTIKRQHLENWFRCLEPTAKFLREATWETFV